jgi:hypothetical protein
MNPVFQIILIALACAAVIAGAVIAANIYRRREAAADAQWEAARAAERARAASYVPERKQPTPAQAAPARHDARPVQQTVVHDSSGTDLVNLLVMQQVLNSVGHDHHHEGHHEERSEEHNESAVETQESVQEPVTYEAPAYTAPEPASYTAPEPVYTAPEPSYSPPSYDSSPSYSDSSSSYSDSGSSGGGGDF